VLAVLFFILVISRANAQDVRRWEFGAQLLRLDLARLV